MGCCSSRRQQIHIEMSTQSAKIMGPDSVDKQSLTDLFRKIDTDGDGEISYGELLRHVGEPQNVLMKRMFECFTREVGGQAIPLDHFIRNVWTYCSMERNALVKLSFDLFDVNRSGEIDLGDVRLLLTQHYGKNRFRTSRYMISIRKKLEVWERRLKHKQSQKISRRDFADFTLEHQSLLFPASKLQEKLQKNFLGKKYWIRAINDRRERLKMEGRSKKRIQVLTHQQSQDQLSEKDERYKVAFDEMAEQKFQSMIMHSQRKAGKQRKTKGRVRKEYIASKQRIQSKIASFKQMMSPKTTRKRRLE